MRIALPDLDALLALGPDDQGAVLQQAIIRTWLDVDGYGNAPGRRAWFTQWRAWLDAAELHADWPRGSVWLFHAALDALEAQCAAAPAGAP